RARSRPPRPARCRRSSSAIRERSRQARSRRGCNGWKAPMASLHSASLHRRLDALTAAVRRRVQHRDEMREKARACATIRAALAEADIDAAQNDGVRHFAYAERVVSQWPDTPALQRADATFVAQDPQLASHERLAAA